jgi:hypothetical protein
MLFGGLETPPNVRNARAALKERIRLAKQNESYD